MNSIQLVFYVEDEGKSCKMNYDSFPSENSTEYSYAWPDGLNS